MFRSALLQAAKKALVRPFLGVGVLTLPMEPPNATLASMKKVTWRAGCAIRVRLWMDENSRRSFMK
ncbi:MAG: hypothetical protein A2284_08895 [Deltaproteobacteria bacterium RIFOXYA12_FULL_61_11]|nr:MAG: hypothetical protein A2284_08895 [Deltaproteobacteria bacterium RIFOXYA12_FULL_61_11]